MLKRALIFAAAVLPAFACGDSGEFNPSPESYVESRVAIQNVVDLQTVAGIDSTFFGMNNPLLGRVFSAQEYGEGSSVAILSHAFWLDHFEGRPDVIGSEIEVGGVARRIVGIMPQGVDVPPAVALWIPR